MVDVPLVSSTWIPGCLVSLLLRPVHLHLMDHDSLARRGVAWRERYCVRVRRHFFSFPRICCLKASRPTVIRTLPAGISGFQCMEGLRPRNPLSFRAVIHKSAEYLV